MGRHRIVPEDPAHVVEQLGCRQHHGRITELVEAVEEELSVLVALGCGAGEPLSGLLPILPNIPAQEIQLSQCVLGKGIFLFGSSSQVLQSLYHILCHRLTGEIELSQTVLGKLVSMPGGPVQPAYGLRCALLGKKQFTKGVF